MALTESEKLKIAKILNVNYIEVNDQIFNLGTAYITDAVEADVRVELTRWETAGSKFVNIHPLNANRGAEVKAEREKNDIRQNLANLLYLVDSVYKTNTSAQVQLVRG